MQLAESTITTGDLIGLRVGDIITTEKDIHSPLTVTVEGVPKFRPPRRLQGPQGDSDRRTRPDFPAASTGAQPPAATKAVKK